MSDILDTSFAGKDVNLDDHRVSLGDDVNILAKDPALRKIHIGFGWDLTSFDADHVDLDVSVFLTGKDGKTRADEDFVFYNNMEALGGGIKHNGDSRTGAGEGDDEGMSIDLQEIPFDVQSLVFVISIYRGQEKAQAIRMVHNAYIRVVNDETNIELLRYDLDPVIADRPETSMIAAQINREGPKWHFVPKAEYDEGGLASVATKYGIIVA